MPQCKRDGCDVEIVNPRASFCGDACRMAHKRLSKSPEQVEKDLPEQMEPEQATRTQPPTAPECRSMPYSVLRSRIDSYEADSWVDSPEFAEVKRRLNDWTLTELKASGQPVPPWRALKGEVA